MSHIIKIGIPFLIAYNMAHTVSHVVLNVTAVEGNNSSMYLNEQYFGMIDRDWEQTTSF